MASTMRDHVARYEREWSWENLDPATKAKFTDRVVAADPETAWGWMTVPHRRELLWHMSRTPEQRQHSWEEDVHRLRLEADEETIACFLVLTGLTGATDE